MDECKEKWRSPLSLGHHSYISSRMDIYPRPIRDLQQPRDRQSRGHPFSPYCTRLDRVPHRLSQRGSGIRGSRAGRHQAERDSDLSRRGQGIKKDRTKIEWKQSYWVKRFQESERTQSTDPRIRISIRAGLEPRPDIDCGGCTVSDTFLAGQMYGARQMNPPSKGPEEQSRRLAIGVPMFIAD